MIDLLELVLAAVGTVGLAAALAPGLARRGLAALEALLVAILTAAVGAGVLLSWVLLAGLPPVVVWAVWAVAGSWAAARERDLGATLWEGAAAVRAHGVVWGVVAVVAGIQVVLTGLTLAHVGDIGWDAATYHLPQVGSMLQEGSLFGWPDLRPWMYYPALVEVQATVLGGGLGSVKAATLTQLAYWLWLLGFMAAVLTHRVARPVAAAGVVVVASIPTLWLQARTLYVDVAFAAVFVAAAVVVVIAWQRGSRALVLVAAGLTGALFAIKLGALPAIPLVVAVAVVAIVVVRMRWDLVAVVALGVVATTPFLVRNTIEWSNPTYPVSLTEARERVDAWPGYAPYSLTEIDWYVDTNQRPPSLRQRGTIASIAHQYVKTPTREFAALLGVAEAGDPAMTARLDAREGGFGFAWLLTVLAGGVAMMAAGLARTATREWRWAAVPGGLAVIAVAAVVATQSAWWPRFTLGPAVLLVLASLLTLDRVRAAAVVAAGIAVVAGVGLAGVERAGGYPYWTSCEGPGCVTSEADRAIVREFGLSALTLEYEPLVEAEVATVAIVGDEPNWARPYFPVGLWSPDWQTTVDNLVLGSPPAPGTCHDAYLADASDADWVRDWTAESDPDGTFETVPWEDWRGDRVFLLRTEPCDGSAGR